MVFCGLRFVARGNDVNIHKNRLPVNLIFGNYFPNTL